MLTGQKVQGRKVRHLRIRARVIGTPERPLAAVDSRAPDFRQKAKAGGNVAAAKIVGELLAQRAKASGITQVVFDRGGYQYHGRVKALAEAARAAGLAF